MNAEASSSTSTNAPTTAGEDTIILPSTVGYSPELLSTFKPSRVFRKHNEKGRSFTSLSFDDKGEYLITAADDETLQLFNARTGKHQKQLFSKKYGVHLARFTHKSTAVIHASTKEDDGIRYLNLHDNTYVRYFKGHSKKVVSLQMSPQDDTFLSGATDDTVRLWDLRSANSQGLLNIAGSPCVAYDPSGTVFAVVLNLRSTILLYDLKNYDKMPFLSVRIEDPVLSLRAYPPRVPVYTSVEFSNDGKWLLVGTSGDVHYVVDAFEGTVVARLEAPLAPGSTAPITGLERSLLPPYDRPLSPSPGISSEEVSWTPDGRFVISGSVDGRLHIWDVAPPHPENIVGRSAPGPTCTLLPVKSIEGHLGGPSRCVRVNPRSAMIASAGNELAFWLPDSRERAFPGTEVTKSNGSSSAML